MRLALPSVPFPPLRFVLGTLALYGVFLVVTAPAWIIAEYLPRLTGTPMAAEVAHGTLWSGEFSGVTLNLGAGQSVRLDEVKWRVAPLALLRGEFALRMDFKGAAAQGNGTIGRGLLGGLHLSEFKANFGAALLPQVLPALDIWKPGGTFEVIAPDFTYSGADSRGTAEVFWRKAAITLSPINPIGEYRLAVDASRGVQYQLSTIDGPLKLDGQGAWTANQQPTFNGTARTQAQFQGQLIDLMRLLGKEESGGVFRIRWPPPT
jgi:general secretion pathway protein N